MKKIYIATSGFSYGSWKNTFYPGELPSSGWLAYYCTKFNSLELNNTFYRFPRLKTLQSFYQKTPENFLFSVKAHKIITHTMRLKNAGLKVIEFLDVVQEGLKEKLGCVLFQLPPSFKYNEENLDCVLESLPPSNHHVVEFRHESWWNNKVTKALRKNKLTFCSVSFPNLPEDFHLTTDTFYLRMHGVPQLFVSSYADKELSTVAKKIPVKAKELFIYFNNTGLTAAIYNANYLKDLLSK